LREAQSNGFADTARGTGDEGYFTIQEIHRTII
jgi:hypothetical protein